MTFVISVGKLMTDRNALNKCVFVILLQGVYSSGKTQGNQGIRDLLRELL